MPDARTVLITGAGRGLGRDLAHAFASRGLRTIACAREPTDWAGSGSTIRHATLDLADIGSIRRLAEALGDERIDIVVHNAAIRGDVGGLASFDTTDFLAVMQVNVAGPLHLTRELGRSLTPDARIAFISSRAGSCAEGADPDGDYAYVASKAALNRLVVKLADDIGQIPFALHPGWLRTDMGGPHAPLDTATSARALADLILGSDERASGTFRDWSGQRVAW